MKAYGYIRTNTLVSMFFTPLLTIPLVWRNMESSKLVRVLLGLFFAFVLSLIFFLIGLSILLRNGLGPG